VVIWIAEEAEVDEMWSFVRQKKAPRWLWHAIDHRRGKVLAYVFGRRQDEVFLKLQALLEPFGTSITVSATFCHPTRWKGFPNLQFFRA
jgi:IS1 family transposase